MSVPEATQTEVYPPPPAWFKLYRPDADGSAERPLNPLPPEPATEDYESFGRLEPVEPGIPSLTVKQLFHLRPNGTVDFKGELQTLNKELPIQYLQFIRTLTDQPSSYGRDIEAIGTIFRNMHFLLNCLRAHQARASLEHITITETKDRQEAIEDLRRKRSAAQKIINHIEMQDDPG